jgi:iron complex transport system substrate-binding protein
MKTILKKPATLLLCLVLLLSAAACSSAEPAGTSAPTATPLPTAAPEPTSEPTPVEDVDGELILDHQEELQFADGFTLTRYKGGYTMFTVTYNSGKEYLIVPEGKSVPENLSDTVVVLQQPLNKISLNSTGMVSVVDAIGGLDHIATVGYDVDSWYLDNVIAKMQAGEILYSGSYKEPDFELLAAEGILLEVDTTMLDGYPEVMAKYDELGIPSFVESSSQEGHPLGRVEWVKLFGALMGLEEEADAYFAQQVATLEAVTAAEQSGKTVAMFYISSSSGKVYPRNGGDYMANMIDMAGGDYVMADVSPEETGTTASTFEDVYARCIDADYLFYINFALKLSTIEEMVEYNPLFADFKAVQDKNVYITAPSFTQSTAAIAGIIEDMHTVLSDPTVETTDSLIKLH